MSPLVEGAGRGCSSRGHLTEARVTVGIVQWVLGSEKTQSLLEMRKETGREEEIPPALKFSPTALQGPNLVGSRRQGILGNEVPCHPEITTRAEIGPQSKHAVAVYLSK